jgi:selenocysteine-specific elongation factor
MLAGVGAVDACLFVVAATEGWKPQSEEHLRILEVLGIGGGVVALTKVGLLDDDDVELARLDLADHLAGSPLAGAEVVAVDAPTGVGLGELRLALDRLVAATPAATDLGRPRLWVDRAFAAKGAGTVVTGTLTGGTLTVDDAVEVADRPARVRGLQSLGRAVEAIGPGNRVAVNLVGVSRDDTQRGHALVRPGEWHHTATVDASLTVLASLDHDVSRRGAWLAYVGSGEHPARVRVLGPDRIAPGATGLVRLHLPAPLPLRPGDRYVLRESGRQETVGGGEVLDVAPVLPASRAHPDRSAARVVAERGWVRADDLTRLLGGPVPPEAGAVVGSWVAAPATVEAMTASIRERVAAAGDLGLDIAALDDRERAVLSTLDGLLMDAGMVRAAGVGTQRFTRHPFVVALEAAPFSPPSAAEVGIDRAELRELVRRRLVVERDGHHFAPEAVAAAAVEVARLLGRQPEGVTAGEVRDALGTTRKHVIPLLAMLDALGVTRRRGDLRIAGPRLPEVD